MVCAEIGLTQSDAMERLTEADLYEWMTFFELRREEEEKAIRKAKAESQAARGRRR